MSASRIEDWSHWLPWESCSDQICEKSFRMRKMLTSYWPRSFCCPRSLAATLRLVLQGESGPIIRVLSPSFEHMKLSCSEKWEIFIWDWESPQWITWWNLCCLICASCGINAPQGNDDKLVDTAVRTYHDKLNQALQMAYVWPWKMSVSCVCEQHEFLII